MRTKLREIAEFGPNEAALSLRMDARLFRAIQDRAMAEGHECTAMTARRLLRAGAIAEGLDPYASRGADASA